MYKIKNMDKILEKVELNISDILNEIESLNLTNIKITSNFIFDAITDKKTKYYIKEIQKYKEYCIKNKIDGYFSDKFKISNILNKYAKLYDYEILQITHYHQKTYFLKEKEISNYTYFI